MATADSGLPLCIAHDTVHSPSGGFVEDGSDVPESLQGLRVRFRTWADAPQTDTGPCPECRPYDGNWMDIEDAENLIPLHPNCVCYYEFDEDVRLSVTRGASPGETRPYEGEHACRLEDPDGYDRFRRENAFDEDDGRQIDAIWGVDESGDDDVVDLQSLRYPVEDWVESDARDHCTAEGGIEFEPATDSQTMTEQLTKTVTRTASTVETREIKEDEEVEVLVVPISSTRTDREDDDFSADGLQSMRRQIREEQPLVFLNHGFTDFSKPLYDARDAVGTQVDAEIVEMEKPDAEDEQVLNSYILPDTTHPEGERMLERARAGQALKFSVGFRVLDFETDDEDEESDEPPARTFHDVDLMETSMVGIPAQPDASVTAAAKAAGLAGRLGETDGVEIDDEARFAAALAHELVTNDGPITQEDVADATPVVIDGQTVSFASDYNDLTVSGTGSGDASFDAGTGEGLNTSPAGYKSERMGKSPDDVGPQDWAELVADHFDGADADDLLDAWDDFDYVGSANLDDVAGFVATIVDEETDTVSEQFATWLDGEDDETTTEPADEPEDTDADAPDDDDRVAELEAELAELRERVESGDVDAEDADTEGGAEPAPDESGSADDEPTKSVQEEVLQT